MCRCDQLNVGINSKILEKHIHASFTYIDNGLVLVGGSRPSVYVGIVGLRAWIPPEELGMSIPRGPDPHTR